MVDGRGELKIMKSYSERVQAQLANPRKKEITLRGTITEPLIINRSVILSGEVLLKAPLLIGDGLQVTFEGLDVTMGSWNAQIGVQDSFKGHLILNHVNVWYGKSLIKDYETHANTGAVMGALMVSNAYNSTINITNSFVANAALSAHELSIMSSKVGTLFGPQSTFYGDIVKMSGSTITNYELTGDVQLANIATNGGLWLHELTAPAQIKNLIIEEPTDLNKHGGLSLMVQSMEFIYRLVNQISGPEFVLNTLVIDGDAKISDVYKRAGVDNLTQRFGYGLALVNIQAGDVTIENVHNPERILEYESVTFGDLKLVGQQSEVIQASGNGSISQVADPTKQKSLGQSSAALQKLNHMIGLDSVKSKVKRLIASTAMRKQRGQKIPALHMVFSGNAGTGKTTVADLIGQALFENGVIASSKVVHATKKDLVAGYKGQTAEKTRQVIESAYDGVLFIDEAYALTPDANSSDNDFEGAAITELLAQMEDHRDRLVVILAGYTKEMKDFMASNQGLNSRFKTWIEFPDYGPKDLTRIAIKQLQASDVPLTKSNAQQLAQAMSYFVKHGLNDGNGRFVRNFVETIMEIRDVRLFEGDPQNGLLKSDIIKGMKQIIKRATI